MAKSKGTTLRRANTAIVQKKKRRAKVEALRLNPVVAKLVDRRIGKKAESHEAIEVHGPINFNGSIDSTDVYRTVIAIAQGDNRTNRTGSRIKLTSMTIKGYLKFVPSGTANDSAYAVRMACITDREYSSADQLFFDSDASTNKAILIARWLRNGKDFTAYDGTYETHVLPVNVAQCVTHYDRTHYLVGDRVLAEIRGGSQDTTTRTAVRVIVRPFTIKLKVKNKVLKYNDDGETHPTGFNPVMLFGFYNLEDPENVVSDTRVQCNYHVHMRWKDM